MKRKNTKLYNIIFPVWIIAMFPPFIFVTLPLNFIIDRLVLVCTMKHLHTDNYRQIVKKCIWKVWGLGFLADFVGAVFIWNAHQLEHLFPPQYSEWTYRCFCYAVRYNPFNNIWSFLWTAGCIILSAVCIYFFNMKISLRNTAFSIQEKKRICLSLAVFTAPYLFLVPIEWFA